MRSASTQSKITGGWLCKCSLWALGFGMFVAQNVQHGFSTGKLVILFHPAQQLVNEKRSCISLGTFANDLDMEGVFPVGRCVVLDLLALDPLGALRSGLSTSTPFFSVGSLREISFWSVCY